MSHSIDLDGISEKLVLLQHYCFGSKQYCEDRLSGSIEDVGNYEFDKYWGWTKGIVSNYILECSIKQRVIQDTFKDNFTEFSQMDQKACERLKIGKIILGDFDLSLRETCNKIIHAVNVIPMWNKEMKDSTEFQYWNGKYRLSGVHFKNKWELVLDIYQWSKAYEIFIDLFEETDNYHYLGQDFINSKK